MVSVQNVWKTLVFCSEVDDLLDAFGLSVKENLIKLVWI